MILELTTDERCLLINLLRYEIKTKNYSNSDRILKLEKDIIKKLLTK